MTTNMLTFIVAVIVTLLILGISLYYYITTSTLEEIRADVYELFLKAEHHFTETKQGKQKMEWVVQRARSLLPEWARMAFTYDFLYMIIDEWFDEIKDLLDDGKNNDSVEGE